MLPKKDLSIYKSLLDEAKAWKEREAIWEDDGAQYRDMLRGLTKDNKTRYKKDLTLDDPYFNRNWAYKHWKKDPLGRYESGGWSQTVLGPGEAVISAERKKILDEVEPIMQDIKEDEMLQAAWDKFMAFYKLRKQEESE